MKIIFVLLFCLCVFGCDFCKKSPKTIIIVEKSNNSTEHKINYSEDSSLIYKIITIKNHEYIASFSAYRNWIIGPHCVDCKFCKEKQKNNNK